MAQPLRLLLGLIIIAFPAVLGWHFRSAGAVPILGAVYVPLYFLGKAGAWRGFSDPVLRRAILKAVPLTFAIQTVLAGVFYLVGLGLGTLFTERTMAPSLGGVDAAWLAGFAALVVPAALYIAYADRADGRVTDEQKHATDTAAPVATERSAHLLFDDGDDFAVHTRTVTPETFYRSPHFSRRNAAGIALTTITDHSGNKPQRTPPKASEAMLERTETKLDVRLPQTLRQLYRIQDGGSLPTYYVPREPGAAQTYDGWRSAFADDYNDLKPLSALTILQDDYDEHFDPEYDDESDKAHWIAGADKLIILTDRTGYGTALDYRNGPEPGVLLYDHNNAIGEKELLSFDTFDAFFSALREIESDPDGAAPEHCAYGAPPNPLDPDGFWQTGNAGAGITPAQWQALGDALGVRLPATLLPFFKAANGGQSKYAVALPEQAGADVLRVFPSGPYVDGGMLLKAEQFASLATLSDRLDFVDGATPWRDLYEQPEKLIVISAAFDSALLLDYRAGDEPAVVAVADLDEPDSAIEFASVDAFLARLRRYGDQAYDARNDIGDTRISPRRADAATFWIEDPERGPVPDDVARNFTRDWGFEQHGLPNAIRNIYDVQDGGRVRFRYAPPQSINDYGHMQHDATSAEWLDVMPDGLLPMSSWQTFEDWRKTNHLATDQSLFDFTNRVKAPYSDDDTDTKINLFVIGDHTSVTPRMVTVMDLSTGPFVRNREIMTLRYNADSDVFETVFGPIMADNVFSGLMQSLKALKDDL